MFLRPLSPSARFLVCFGLTAPSVLVTIACVLTFQDQGKLEKAFDWVRHALQVENRVHQLVLDVHEFEAGQRGYLYTGRAAYLDSFQAGEASVTKDLEYLRADTRGDPAQQERLLELETLVLDRLDLARQTIDLQRSGRHDAALKLVRGDRGKSAMDGIQVLADEMRRHEENLLGKRDRDLANWRAGRAHWLYGLLLLNLSSLACTLFLLHRLGKAQSLARVCAWSKRVELEGQWLSFEEYLSRRFQIDTTHTISPSEVDRLLTEIAPESVPMAACEQSHAELPRI
jgi:CHASE3 domain sensor protein